MNDAGTTPQGNEEEKNLPTEDSEELDAILQGISETGEEAVGEELSLVQRLIGIFTQPGKVFNALRSKPDFIIPLVITILMSIFSGYMVYDVALDDSIQRIEQNEKFSEQQKDKMIENIESRRLGVWRTVSIVAFPTVGVVVIVLLVTLIFWFVGNVVLGGKATFKQLLSAYSYSWLIYGVPGTLVSTWLILKYQTLKIPINLAALMPESAGGTALYRFLESVDIFTVWFLIVFGIGFATMYRFSRQKGLITVFSVWLLYVIAFKVALGSLFGQFGG